MRGERPVRRLNSRIQSTTRGGLGQRCAKLRGVEDEKRAALAALLATSHALLADATDLPGWLVEIVPPR